MAVAQGEGLGRGKQEFGSPIFDLSRAPWFLLYMLSCCLRFWKRVFAYLAFSLSPTQKCLNTSRFIHCKNWILEREGTWPKTSQLLSNWENNTHIPTLSYVCLLQCSWGKFSRGKGEGSIPIMCQLCEMLSRLILSLSSNKIGLKLTFVGL